MASSACVLAAAALIPAAPAFVPVAGALPGNNGTPLHTQGPIAGFDADMSNRIAAVDNYLATRPGVTGYVMRDRVTGGIYRNANADTSFWTASTIKLAIAEDLLNRARIGAITLGPDDRSLMESMLATSNDTAADILWNKFAGFDRMSFNNAFRANGMTGLVPLPPTTSIEQVKMFPDWGFQQCAPADLDRLMDNVLTRMHPDDRAYLLDRMRRVDTNQHWGVWGAGAAMNPGLKNGWSDEQGGWVVNSVGFAGPAERYTLAIMTEQGNQGGYTDGAETTTHVAQLLFQGR
ncbi:tat pathway signal sequence [Nocardia seriolae]|uniref:Beta-lactamase n=1 Tax=Nocardia seriolae TaxID=37332 RepID=A0ABC8AYH7_9NOCA|nr:Beta-lactamase [Nocardia seriolae]MTJ63358.1 tat pathway signal sequence [Nocardia seriolae]MTJ70240.1 tat pathway signal sequence [Nocardia seriolae]MTJ88839.1 tat pathway signal sequence [Nocardia seriolae]MTK32821.1 tat pathway signal sequence [Nocardia seriolae]